ncbi:MAG TPA: cation diffusion facilitator family transporter [Solirubrobacteraceae bacterium]|nr:cation diffusion facilitator family transporter [Solirubrobacteraceae bacterium]
MAHHHAHPPAAASHGRVAWVLALILVFMAVEVLAGILANSLVLISDAGHMLTDAFALGAAIVALRVARRPAAGAQTYGMRRVEILSAQANGITLLLVAAWIVYQAVARLISPEDVHATVVLVVALAGALVNLAGVRLLAGGRSASSAIEGSYQHIVTDLFAFAAAAIAALVILATGFDRADAIASIFVAALMVRSGIALVRASWRVFLESAPEGLDPREIGRSLAELDGVVEVHDLHVWEIANGYAALSAHVVVAHAQDAAPVAREMEALLHERFAVDHTTLQVDVAGSGLVQLQPAPGWGASSGSGSSDGPGSR